MGFYIRVLGQRLSDIPLAELRAAACPAVIETDGSGEWEEFTLRHGDGTAIAVVERNPVAERELGGDELKEFLEDLPHFWPQSSVDWLREYLPSVRVIYSFQLLSGTECNDGWTPPHGVYEFVWQHAGGILQADGEGFSNEAGYTILWQFTESASGPWNAALLTDRKWENFEMDLGNPHHREAFLAGRVP